VRSGLSSVYRYGDEKTGLGAATGWMGCGTAWSARSVVEELLF
jgi:hypothetical protein